MKRKTREEKAITLIALIITIVVLLILAVVAINAVTGDGIIQHATNAKTEYEKAQDEEESMISYYEAYLDTKGKTGEWIQKEETKIVTDLDGKKVQVKIPSSTITKVNKDGTVQEIKVGAHVNYDPTDLKEGIQDSQKTYTSVGENNTLALDSTGTNIIDQTFDYNDYNGKWRVLGIENGKVLLISAENIKTYSMNNSQLYRIGESELNKICSVYGNGKGAESARSIKVEDVDKITGYNPEILIYKGIDYGYGTYGDTITYSSNGTTLFYSINGGQKQEFSTNRLVRIIDNNWVGGGLGNNETYKITNSEYVYSAKYYDSGTINMNMSESSIEYELLFMTGKYWLASKALFSEYVNKQIVNSIAYTLKFVSTNGVISSVGANGTTEVSLDNQKSRGVRPIVILDTTTDLVLSSDGISYDIKI